MLAVILNSNNKIHYQKVIFYNVFYITRVCVNDYNSLCFSISGCDGCRVLFPFFVAASQAFPSDPEVFFARVFDRSLIVKWNVTELPTLVSFRKGFDDHEMSVCVLCVCSLSVFFVYSLCACSVCVLCVCSLSVFTVCMLSMCSLCVFSVCILCVYAQYVCSVCVHCL